MLVKSETGWVSEKNISSKTIIDEDNGSKIQEVSFAVSFPLDLKLLLDAVKERIEKYNIGKCAIKIYPGPSVSKVEIKGYDQNPKNRPPLCIEDAEYMQSPQLSKSEGLLLSQYIIYGELVTKEELANYTEEDFAKNWVEENCELTEEEPKKVEFSIMALADDGEGRDSTFDLEEVLNSCKSIVLAYQIEKYSVIIGSYIDEEIDRDGFPEIYIDYTVGIELHEVK